MINHLELKPMSQINQTVAYFNVAIAVAAIAVMTSFIGTQLVNGLQVPAL